MHVPTLQKGSAAGGTPPGFPADPPPFQAWRTPTGELVAHGFRRGADCWMLWPRLAAYKFTTSGADGITAYPEPGARLSSVWDVYRRSVLPMAMQAAGYEVLHASGIVADGGVVIFCAVSETGKSTMAYGLSRRGFPQWADDGVVVGQTPGLVSLPLPFEVRLRPGSADLLGENLPHHTRFTHNGPGEQTHTAPLPIRAICVLTRAHDLPDHRPAEVTPMLPAEAFTAMLTHAHEFDWSDAHRRVGMVELYLRLVAEVPSFSLRFRPAANTIERLFDTVIDQLRLELPITAAR